MSLLIRADCQAGVIGSMMQARDKMKAPCILFDTSALRASGWNSSPLSSVLELSKAGLIEVYLPELVVAERRSHWAERPKAALQAARLALGELASEPILTAHHGEQVQRVLAELLKLDVDELATEAVEQFIRGNRINELPMTFEQSRAAWRSYFGGSAPHRHPKSRDDIPDAHIFEAAKDLLSTAGEVHFVCADKRLATALKPLAGARVYETLEDLFQSGTLEGPTHLWSRDKIWRKIQHLAPPNDIKAEIQTMLEADLDQHLQGLDFTDNALPGDGTIAHVLWALGGELVEIQNPDDWGGGHLTFQVECECDAGLGMRFPHEDARGLPDWLDVSWGHGGTVEVTAHVRLKVETAVDVEVNLTHVERRLKPVLSKVEFNDPQLFIIRT